MNSIGRSGERGVENWLRAQLKESVPELPVTAMSKTKLVSQVLFANSLARAEPRMASKWPVAARMVVVLQRIIR